MRATLLSLALLLAACGGDDTQLSPDGGGPDAGAPPYGLLSQYGFFNGDGHTQEPVEGVVRYEVAAELFADFAAKHRFIVLPPGGKIGYHPDAKWAFPVGTMLIKTFAYGARLIETRVLIHQATGWLPTTYLWNDAQTDATLHLIGTRVPVTTTDSDGNEISFEYRVPNQNQCYGCHGSPPGTNVLGPHTRQLNRTIDLTVGPVDQLDRMAGLGMFSAPLPPAGERAAMPDPFGDAPLEARARAWLDANCAHCHSAGGAAGSTNLFLGHFITNPLDLGICRLPNAAGAGSGGRRFDIVPGKPEESIMTFRIDSMAPGIKMPEMPIQLVDQRAVELIAEWIAAMPATGCN